MSGCPWENFIQEPLRFCEAPLCSWIRAPANTVSNIGFLVVGAWIFREEIRKGYTLLSLVGAVAATIGVGSALLHASGARLGSGADYLAMFLATGILTALNSRRVAPISRRAFHLIFWGTSLALLGLALLFPNEERLIYTLGAPCCAIELILFFREGGRTDYRQYRTAWFIMGVAVFFWWFDVTKSWCPSYAHWINGHPLWHALLAAAFVPLYRFYRQFRCYGTGSAC